MQPDGDVLGLVADADDDERDSAVQDEHRAAVRKWADEFEATVDALGQRLSQMISLPTTVAACGFAVVDWVLSGVVVVATSAGSRWARPTVAWWSARRPARAPSAR